MGPTLKFQPFKYVLDQSIHMWKSFKVYHTRRKGPNPCCNLFLLYILIPIKSNESKVVKYLKRIIF
jgi:hypothetical protein